MNYKKFLPFLLAFILPLVAIFAWWGGFNPVSITTATRGPYIYAYLERQGDYSGLPALASEVRDALERAGLVPGAAVTLLYSNPDLVEVQDRRARTGFLVPAGTRVAPPLMIDRIPARPVLLVQVRAGNLLAPSRAYAALDAYLQARGSGIRMPTLEHYAASGSVFRMGLFSLEMDSVDAPVDNPAGEVRP